MKNNLIKGLVFLFTMTCAGLTHAQDQQPSANAETQVLSQMTAEEAAKMRIELENFKRILDGKPIEKVEEKKKETTMANVADKALGLFEGMVATVSDSLKKIAPEVWRIMIKQQYANAAQYITMPFVMLIVALVTFFSFRKKAEHNANDGYSEEQAKSIANFFLRAFPIASGVWLAIAIGINVPLLINPEYYAIKDLLTLITDPKSAP